MKGNINKVIVLVRLEGGDQIYQAITDKPTEFFVANTLAGMAEGEINLIPVEGICFQGGVSSTKDHILQSIKVKLCSDDLKLLWWFAHSHRELTVAQAASRIKDDYDLTTAEAEFLIMHFMARRFIHV